MPPPRAGPAADRPGADVGSTVSARVRQTGSRDSVLCLQLVALAGRSTLAYYALPAKTQWVPAVVSVRRGDSGEFAAVWLTGRHARCNARPPDWLPLHAVQSKAAAVGLESNRRQGGQPTPKYPKKNRKKHRILATSFSNLGGPQTRFSKVRGSRPAHPPTPPPVGDAPAHKVCVKGITYQGFFPKCRGEWGKLSPLK